MEIMHKGKNWLNNTQCENAILFMKFDAKLKLLASNEIKLIHQYLACVNAKRLDSTLEPVSFMRWCGMSAAAEILAWKMVNSPN